LPGTGKRLAARSIDSAPSYSEQSIIKGLYAACQKRLAMAGFPVQINLSEFRTVYERDFAMIRFGDVVTTTEPLLLSMVPTTVLRSDGSVVGTSLSLEWRRNPLAEFDAPRPQSLTLAEAREVVANHLGAWRSAIALTSYKVELGALGRDVVYRGAVLWTDEDGNSEVELDAQDYVLDRLGEIAALKGRVDSPAELLKNGHPQ
jgi:hypothetical protein